MTSPAAGDAGTDAIPGLVREFAGRLAPAKPTQTQDDDEFLRDLAYDSLAMFELQFALEELFGLDPMSPAEVSAVWTVADLIELISGLLAAGYGSVPEDSVVDAMRSQHQRSQRA